MLNHLYFKSHRNQYYLQQIDELEYNMFKTVIHIVKYSENIQSYVWLYAL